MKTALVSKESNLVTFTMTFTAEEFDAATDKVFKKNRGKITVDGFRKGKAPRSIIEKRYGSGIFYEEAIDDLLNDNYSAALTELDVEPIARPDVDFGEEKLEAGKGFTATIKVEVVPEVEVKDYKGIAAERKIHTVTDKDVDESIEAMRRKNSRQIVAEDEVKIDDTITLDYKGFVDGEQFEGGTADNAVLKIGSNTFIPGFEVQLIGVKPGESKDIEVTFPNEYQEESLAGKPATFKCTVKEIKREELPELNDEFAKDVSEFDTLEQLKEDQKKKLEESAEKAKEYNGKDAVVAKLIELNKIDVPKAMIDTEADRMIDEYAQQMSYQGLSIDMYLQYMGRTMDDLKQDMMPNAETRVKSRLALAAVAKAENLEATDADVEAEYEKLAQQYKMEVEKLKEMFGTGNANLMKEDIINNKAVQFLYDNAVFTDVADDAEKPEA